MGLIYSTATRTGRMDVVKALIDSKTLAAATGAGSAATLVIGTSALSGATGVIATIPLSTTPFTIASGVATFNGLPLSVAASLAGTNTIAKAELRNNTGTVIRDGMTVGLSGTDIIVDRTTVAQGQYVTVTAAAITHGD